MAVWWLFYFAVCCCVRLYAAVSNCFNVSYCFYYIRVIVMDYLKTKAPFWKRETTTHGERWIEGRESDQQAAEKWL